MHQTENLNVIALDLMPSPDEVKSRVPLTERAAHTVVQGRRALEAILDGRDHRLFVVVGPCSIHDPVAGLDYARRLKALADEISGTMAVVMRVYFEKPRTSLGWKGFINDPHMDDSFRVDEGMARARRFLLDVNELGLPAGRTGDLVLGALGQLQFEVVKYRLEAEYGVDVRVEAVPWQLARWVSRTDGKPLDLSALHDAVEGMVVLDVRERAVVLFDREWALRSAEKFHPEYTYAETAHGVVVRGA